jgi:hypothetical protein
LTRLCSVPGACRPGAWTIKDDKKIVLWKAEIVMDETRLKKDDLVFDTLDFKIRGIHWQYLQ